MMKVFLKLGTRCIKKKIKKEDIIILIKHVKKYSSTIVIRKK